MWEDLDDDRLRAWARRAMAARKVSSGAELARLAGEDPSTINRWLNRTTRRPKPETIANISRVLELEPGHLPEEPVRPPVTVADAEPMSARNTSAVDTFLDFAERLKAGSNGIAPMRVTGNTLRSLGYLPGDVLLVDLNALPEPHDIVCAQLYDWQRPGGTITVFRVFEPPYLVSPAIDIGDMMPMAIDPRRVTIKGVVIGSMRGRRSLRSAA
jgi:transcriptional regulator with XRE-family HTH domain